MPGTLYKALSRCRHSQISAWPRVNVCLFQNLLLTRGHFIRVTYIAVSYNHEEHPPIVEAADSKWWGIKEALHENDIEIVFADEEYIRKKYQEK